MKKHFKRIVSIILVVTFMAQPFIPILETKVYAVENHSPDREIPKRVIDVDLDKLLDACEDDTDSDGDTIPDEVERIIGTDSEMPDSDMDKLDDYDELSNGLDPLNPDSNRDGLADYYEVLDIDGKIQYDLDTDNDGILNIYDFDNDGDGVGDGTDISPFSYGSVQESYDFNIKSDGEETYIDIQIKPEDEKGLYEKNQVYDWELDTKGTIMDIDDSEADFKITPFLEVESSNMPSDEECAQYGIMTEKNKMYIPLFPIIENGMRVALRGKIFIPAGETETDITARLIWSFDFMLDVGEYHWSIPKDTKNGSREYAKSGADVYDIDHDGEDDLFISSYEEMSNELYYALLSGINQDGEFERKSAMEKIPVDTSKHKIIDTALAVGDANSSGSEDLFCMLLVKDGDSIYSKLLIGYDLNEHGEVSEWSDLIEVREYNVNDKYLGIGMDIGDFDKNGENDLVFGVVLKQNEGKRHFQYNIGWNYMADNVINLSKDYTTNPIQADSVGGSITIVDVDRNGKDDLIFSLIDDLDGANRFMYTVGYDISPSDGEYTYQSDTIDAGFDMGHQNTGGSIMTTDVDDDGVANLLFVAVDGSKGDNEFWLYSTDNIDSNGEYNSDEVKKLERYYGIKNGLRSTIKFEEGLIYVDKGNNEDLEVSSWIIDKNDFDIRHMEIKDIDSNGLEDIYLTGFVGVVEDYDGRSMGYYRQFYSIGYDMDENGSVVGWSKPIVEFDRRFESKSESKCVKRDFDGDGFEEMYYYRNSGDYSEMYGNGSCLFKFPTPNESTDFQVVDLNDNDKADFIIVYKESIFINKEYLFYDDYDYQYNLDVIYDGDLSTKKTYRLHEIVGDSLSDLDYTGSGIGVEVLDINGDNKLDAIVNIFVSSGESGAFKTILKLDVEGDGNTIVQEPNSSTYDWVYFDFDGIAIASTDFNNNGCKDLLTMMADKKSGEIITYKVEDIQSKPITLSRDYENFSIVGMTVEENDTSQLGLIYGDMNSNLDNDKNLIATYETMRGYFLKDTKTISESFGIVTGDGEGEYNRQGLTLKEDTFDHSDQAVAYRDKKAKEIFKEAEGNRLPFVIAASNNSRTLTFDSIGKNKIISDSLSFDLTTIDYSTTRMLQLRWYNGEENAICDGDDIIRGVDSEWGWSELEDKQSKIELASLLINWDVAEIKVTHIDNKSILPDKKEWNAKKWGVVTGKSILRLKDICGYSRQSYQIFKVLPKITNYTKWGTKSSINALNAYVKLMNGVNITDVDMWKLRNITDSHNVNSIANKFKSGAKMKALAKWGNRVSLAVDFGVSIYMGVVISEQLQQVYDESYARYGGGLYASMKITFTTIKYLIPILGKLKYAAAGSGVGTIIVALVELSDLLTWLISGDSGWSDMAIGAIFNELFGLEPNVEVNLEGVEIDNAVTYEGMEKGFFVVGSKIIYRSKYRETVEDIIDSRYDDKDDIRENYMKPNVRYYGNEDLIECTNEKEVEEVEWQRSRGEYLLTREYDFKNTIKFKTFGKDIPVKSVNEVESQVYIWKKGIGEDYFKTDHKSQSETSYFDVIPNSYDQFIEYYNTAKGISNNDPDGDGLLNTSGNKEKGLDGEVVDSDNTLYDTDGDGIDDYYENEYGSNPRDADTDHDGLSDKDELIYKTDINNADTDGDGLSDGRELEGYVINIRYNGQEIKAKVYSDPNLPNRDGDEMDDFVEYSKMTNPNTKHTHGDPKWDGNHHTPTITEIPDETEKVIGTEFEWHLPDFFKDYDGDDLIYSTDVGEIKSNILRYTYEGGVVPITVTADDQRGGVAKQRFTINDTSAPYIKGANSDISDLYTKIDYDKLKNSTQWAKAKIYFYINEDFRVDSSMIELYSLGKIDTREDIIKTPIPFIASNLYGNILIIDPINDLITDNYEYQIVINPGAIIDTNNNLNEFVYDEKFKSYDNEEPKVTDIYVNDVKVMPSEFLTLNVGDEVLVKYHEDLFWQHGDIAWFKKTFDDKRYFITRDRLEDDRSEVFIIPQELLENGGVYEFVTNVRDKKGNRRYGSALSFTAGKVKGPSITLPSNKMFQTEHYTKVDNQGMITIPYDTIISPDENFDKIELNEMVIDILSGHIKSAQDEKGPATEFFDKESTSIPCNVEVRGNSLVVKPRTALIPSAVYNLKVPDDALIGANGLSTREKEVKVANSIGVAPKVVRTGSIYDDKIGYGHEIYVQFNQYIKADNLDLITLTTSDGTQMGASFTMLSSIDKEGPDKDSSMVMLIAPDYYTTEEEISENEILTVNIPSGAVKGALEQPNVAYTEKLQLSGSTDIRKLIGTPCIGEQLIGNFEFSPEKSKKIRKVKYQWYRCDDEEGTNRESIVGATSIGYIVQEEDLNKYLVLGLTPTLPIESAATSEIQTQPVGPVKTSYTNNMNLSQLVVKDGENILLEEAENIENNYVIVVDSDVEEVVVSATKDEEKSKIYIVNESIIPEDDLETQTIGLDLGKNSVGIIVDSQDGRESKTYTVIIERSKEDEANIKPEGDVQIWKLDVGEASDVFTGDKVIAETVYYDRESRLEGEAQFKWYKSTTPDANNLKFLSEGKTYIIQDSDLGAYIYAEYLPVTNTDVEGELVLSSPTKTVAQADEKINISVTANAENIIEDFSENQYVYELTVEEGTEMIDVHVASEDVIKINEITSKDQEINIESNEKQRIIVEHYSNDVLKATYYLYVTSVNSPPVSSGEKAITAFSFAEQTGVATIDEGNHTVDIEVANGTDVTNLVATFTLSEDATADISDVAQTNTVTQNDFTNPVTYTITAEDTTEQDWVVTVTVSTVPPVQSSENDIISFVLGEQTEEATTNKTNHTVSIEVVNGTNVTNLVPVINVSAKATVNPANGEAKDFTNPVTYTVTAEDGTTQDWVVTVTVKAAPPVQSSENNITSFALSEQTKEATINKTSHTVSIEVANGTNITSLIPTIEISAKATINPESGVAKDFTNPVTYTVTAEDGTIQEWEVTVTVATVPPVASDEKEITAFSFAEQTGVARIDEGNHTVDIEVANGTDVTNLVATFTLSEDATADISDVAQTSTVTSNDFTNPVTYTVTAEDGTIQDWVVTVATASPVQSSENDITSFELGEQTKEATINKINHTVSIEVVNGTNVTNLVPVINVSPKATINPASEEAKDFTNSVTYTVTAEDGKTQEWEVRVTVATAPPAQSSEKDITGFVLGEQTEEATINTTSHTVSIEVANGTDVTNLSPVIVVSPKATVNPASEVAKDFTNPVTYTVTAEDEKTQDWVVTVTVATAPSSTKSIASYNPVTLTQTGDIAHNNVQYRTSSAVISVLPSNITATLEDGSKRSVPVSWTDTDNYNAKVAEYYTFTATWQVLPSGVDNDDHISPPTCELKVTKGSTGGGSSSGGSSYNPRSKTPTEKASDEIKKAKPNADGIIKVSAEAKTTNKGKTTLRLPDNFLKNKAPVELTIENKDLQVTLKNKMFTEKEKQVKLVIEPADKEALGLTEEEKKEIEDTPVYNIYLKINGKKVDWEGNEDITIAINLDDKENKEDHKFVAVYYDRKGNIQILKSSYYENGRLYFTTKHLSDYGVIYVEPTFKDIKNHWAKEAIEALTARGIIKGVSKDEFRPEEVISRADLVTLMVRYFGFTSDSVKVFEDVDSSKYYAESIAIAKEIGLVKGDGNDMFKPLEPVSRQDMMVLLQRVIEISGEYPNIKWADRSYLNSSDSNDISSYALKSVEQMINSKIVKTRLEGIEPKENATRAEVAHALYNILKMNIR